MVKLAKHIRTASIRCIIGFLVATIFLLLVEGGLRLLPLDRWGGGPSIPVFIPGEGPYAENFVTNKHFKGAMSFQSFRMVKPAGVTRIFVVGGSAALGWPGQKSASFAAYIQRSLDRVLPDKFEVVNVSAMSYASFRVLDILHEIVSYDPDYVVIWSGNNEYIEHSFLTPTTQKLRKHGLEKWLNKSSLYRSIRMLLKNMLPGIFVQTDGEDLTDPRSAPQVRRGKVARSSAVDRQLLENYTENLQDMAQLIKQAGATGILCTVPVNLSAWLPSDNLFALSNEREKPKWESLKNNAVGAVHDGRFRQAADRFGLILTEMPDYSLGHYFLGQSFHSLQRYDEAKDHYNIARDLDPRPIRSFSAFSTVVRELADSEGLLLADLESLFAAQSGNNLVGLDLFYDYVHPNEAGHKLAATVVLQNLIQDSAYHPFLKQLVVAVAQDNWLINNPGPREDIFYVQGLTYFNNRNYAGAEQAYLKALKARPDFSEAAGNLGIIYDERGDLLLAKEYYLRAVRLDPGNIYNMGLAKVLFALGEKDDAKIAGDRALSLGSFDAELLSLLGDLEFDRGRIGSALKYYQRLAEIDPTYPGLESKLQHLQQ